MVLNACYSFILNMYWLLAGNRMAIVDGLEYEHHWTHGDDSSYIRAPRDKKLLAKMLLNTLKKECAACQS